MTVFPSNDDWIGLIGLIGLIGWLNQWKNEDSYVSSCIVKLKQFIMNKQ